ncbi:MAG: tetratricopeptide repeat protein [Gammaproteobacteria bacterium]|nr:tetratricopeptide repeat protein [Gammaproteobacteria bacterium]
MLLLTRRFGSLLLAAVLISGCSITDRITIGPPGFTERLELADKAFQQGQHDQASALYTTLADENRGLPMPTHRLGIIAYHANDLPEAQTQFERTLTREPEHAASQYNLAMVHLESARRLLRQHERLQPTRAANPTLMGLRRALEQIASHETTNGTGQKP